MELPRAGRFDPARARALGVPVQQWKLLQKGQSVLVKGRTVAPAEVLGAPRKGLSVVFSGDTAPCAALEQAAQGADLLICDATYALPEQEAQAAQWGHSTFGQSAALAARAGAHRLWLTHYSPMITDPEADLPQAQSIFPAAVCGAGDADHPAVRGGVTHAKHPIGRRCGGSAGPAARGRICGLRSGRLRAGQSAGAHSAGLGPLHQCPAGAGAGIVREGQCIPTGLQHGTVTIKYGGQLYETTTFRTEGAYTDGRHPDEVHFVPDVRQDLARRDFTINAMAYNDAEGLIDPFGGQQDLQQGILRAVGDPATRFEEDALRILRLYRFAARFSFAIDPATGQAAQELCAHLDCVSVERIEEELSKLLAAPAPAAYLDEKILKVIIPELSAPALQAAKPVVDACPAGTEDLPVRWAALLMSLGEDGTRKALKRLRCSNTCIEQTAVLVREASTAPGQAPAAPDTVIRIRKLLGRYDLHTVQRLAALGAAMEPERAADFAAQAELAAQLDADGVCCRVSQLAVNGRDLMAAGIPAGPGLRRTLEALLDAVIRGQLLNERQRLLDAVRENSAS